MLSIILPCHNVDQNALKTFTEEIEVQYNYTEIEIIVSNDAEGRGKGWAIRQGLLASRGNVVCFIDGDGDIPASMIARLLPFLKENDVVCGVKPISGIWSRRILTYLSRLYITAMFNVKVDSQTGIKVFKKEFLSDFYNDGFLFDLELLSKAKKKGAKIAECPIDCKAAYKHMKATSIWKTLKESITLWLELR